MLEVSVVLLSLASALVIGLVVRHNRREAERKKIRLTLPISKLIKRAEVEWDTYGDASLFGRKVIRIHPAEIAIPASLLNNYYDEIKFTWEGGIAHVYTSVFVGKEVGKTVEEETIYRCNVLNCSSRYYRTSL